MLRTQQECHAVTVSVTSLCSAFTNFSSHGSTMYLRTVNAENIYYSLELKKNVAILQIIVMVF